MWWQWQACSVTQNTTALLWRGLTMVNLTIYWHLKLYRSLHSVSNDLKLSSLVVQWSIHALLMHACSKLPAWSNAFPTSLYGCTTDVPCPCLNGGMCLPNNYTSLDEITCSCPANSTGEFCQRCKCTLISQTMQLNSGHASSSLYHSIIYMLYRILNAVTSPASTSGTEQCCPKHALRLYTYLYQVTPLSNCQVVHGRAVTGDGWRLSSFTPNIPKLMLSMIEWGYTRFL